MNLNIIKNALLTVTNNVGHYEALKKTDQYIVWAEDGEDGSLWADGKMQEQTITGTVDYFTKTEYDPNVVKIQAALNDAEISFRLNSIQYEEDTKYLHYEWVWSLG